MTFEGFVALRYLVAKRKQTFISIVTIIAILGVASGVAALIVALAVSTGFRSDLQKKLLGGTAHINVKPVLEIEGIKNHSVGTKKIVKIPGVLNASPALYGTVLLSAGPRQDGVMLKGISVEVSDVKQHFFKIIEGDLNELRFDSADEDFKKIAVGTTLSKRLGLFLGDTVSIFGDETVLSPLGEVSLNRRFKIAVIFESGLYDFDDHWVFTSLKSAQKVLGVGRHVSVIECHVDNVDEVEKISLAIKTLLGKGFETIDWKELNRPVFEALRLEKLVMIITIGLIIFVAALNIITTLTMMVMEKTRDIAVLMSMGATEWNIRKIFIFQGLIIGIVGSFFGLILGYSICWICDKYQLIQLQADVYSISHVPFEMLITDGLLVMVVAIFVSFLATLYPSKRASRLDPVDALHYE